MFQRGLWHANHLKRSQETTISSENNRDDNTITNPLRFEGAKQVEMDEDNRHARMVDPHDRVCIFHIDEFTRPGDTAES